MDVDDTDDLEPTAERAAWKLRELLRLKRDRQFLIDRELEREEVERRRNMDADERLNEDLERVKEQEKQKKASLANEDKKPRFLQKYYHKGAFYQDEEILKNRDFQAPVDDQVVNVDNLPKALQVRSGQGIGLAGRTKWTHLANEDTMKDAIKSGWYDKKNNINTRVTDRRGGMKDINDDLERKRRKMF